MYRHVLVLMLGLVFAQGCATGKPNQDHLVASTNYIQRAAEARALIYQAFNIARHRLDIDLKWVKSTKKRAIVVDVDETVVDNSPYQARNILNNKTYNSGSWGEWVEEARAKALPGAVEFLQYAASKGVEVFYITNRKIKGFDATLKNLKELGFPIKKENLLMRVKTSSKTARRAKVTKNHRIVLFMGDNLGDFDEAFEKKPTAERFKITDKDRKQFGKKWIVLPNPMYGDWETALFNYDYKLPEEKKAKARRDNLMQ